MSSLNKVDMKFVLDKVYEAKSEEQDDNNKISIKLDKKHYPGANQGQFCWQIYNEYVHCLKKNGLDDESCARDFGRASTLCPAQWIETWNELRDKGVFPGVNDGRQLSNLHKEHHH